IEVNQRKIRYTRTSKPASVAILARGAVHNLEDIFSTLNREYFAGLIDAQITWGQKPPARARRGRRISMKMGSYSVEDRLIRIHPSLDRPFVPRLFVEWVVYHEMLHQKHDIPLVRGRRQFHTREFLAEEARFAHYHQARLWEHENFDKLLNY